MCKVKLEKLNKYLKCSICGEETFNHYFGELNCKSNDSVPWGYQINDHELDIDAFECENCGKIELFSDNDDIRLEE